MFRMETDTVIEGVIGTVEKDTSGVLTSYELMFQEYLTKRKILISLSLLDSIFHNETSAKNISNTFIINRLNPKTGEILETTDSLRAGKLQGALASDIIPIRVDGSEGVQVLLVSPYRAVFQRMIAVLALSLLLVLFVGYVVFFLRDSLFKEKHLRKLQTDFSHALIHDMATPLQTIAQVNSLLGNEKLYAHPEKRAKYLSLAQQQILNLQALTDRILTVARAEKSELQVIKSSVNINAIIEESVEKFAVQAKKQVHFTTEYAPSHIRLDADETLLRNAVSNLIDNAVKYSGQTVDIDIRCEQNIRGTFIYIQDNGYGISARDQAKIFSQFERGKAVDRNEAKGFGLGLAYVKSVMEAHGGTVNLFSEEGKGTQFVLFFQDKIETKSIPEDEEDFTD